MIKEIALVVVFSVLNALCLYFFELVKLQDLFLASLIPMALILIFFSIKKLREMKGDRNFLGIFK